MSKKIGILGCGWLGSPLGESLKLKGHQVKGTTTSAHKLKSLKVMGIIPYHISLSEEGAEGDIAAFLEDLEVLVINIPPGLRKSTNASFVKRIEHLLNHLERSHIKHIVFVSSTSVYGSIEGEITEKSIPSPITQSGKQLLEVEKLLSSSSHFDTTILRFGGLIGPERHPINFLAGRTNLSNGEELINLIHLDDCIMMIETIIHHNYWNYTFNGVYPYHPTKKEYYTDEASKKGLPLPEFKPSKEPVTQKAIKSHLFYVKGHQLVTSIVS